VQGSNVWQPPIGTLGDILEETRNRLRDASRPASEPAARSRRPSLRQALRTKHVAVIAELKRRSPSKGTINAGLGAAEFARKVESAGAAAISVLTEPTFFDGSLRDLSDVAGAAKIPVLKKDFHIDPVQLRDAVAGGASAVLLIARALPPDALGEMLQASRESGLDALVEVRSEDELARAIESGAEIIGVNSRDLETLEVDARVPMRLVPMIPAPVIAVWESGVSSRDDVQRAAAHGADAVLVGSALSRAPDAASLLASLVSVQRSPRS
jgi:indole-3-glycerol phosphate synthase